MKGWWREETSKSVPGEASASSLIVPSFSRLCKLVLRECPDMTTFPSCPKLKTVELRGCHEALTLLGSRVAIPCNPTSRSVLYLENLTIDNVADCLFGHLLGCAHEVSVINFKGESLRDLAAVVEIASTVLTLSISCCHNLKSLSGFVEHLTNLHGLNIRSCRNLELVTVAPRKSLESLYSLVLDGLPELLNLPNEFQYLTSLQYLQIANCENLETVPEWLNCLTSLLALLIQGCRKLKSLPQALAHMPSLEIFHLIGPDEDLKIRCRKLDGEDWPKICHIPHATIH